MEAPRARKLVALAIGLLLAVSAQAPLAGASHAPDADPAQPHRFSSHPAYGHPTPNDPTCRSTPAEWTPPAAEPIPDELGRLEEVASSPSAFSGAGMTVFGGMAVVAARSGDNHVLDIREPRQPTVLATYGEADTRDVQMLAFPDCRLYAVHATTFDEDRIEIWNLTDPASPSFVGEIDPPRGTHNVGIVPGTPILYNAAAAGGGLLPSILGPAGETRIYDLSDPHDPELVREWENGYSCHDITFHVDPGAARYRAYCAGVEATQIWDVATPTDPDVVATIPFPHGENSLPSLSVSTASFSHWATVSDDGRTLIVGDETGGGLAPACDAHVETSQRSLSGPAGNLYFYDVSDETDPVLEGSLSPGPGYLESVVGPGHVDPFPRCTAHFGDVVGTRDVAVVAFYDAGLLLVDFSDPETPRLVEQWTSQDAFWGAWSYRGTVYGANMDAGLNVLALGPAS